MPYWKNLPATGSHDHAHSHKNINLKAAYIHVITDAATSLLAIHDEIPHMTIETHLCVESH